MDIVWSMVSGALGFLIEVLSWFRSGSRWFWGLVAILLAVGVVMLF